MLASTEVRIFHRNSNPFGKSWEEWTTKWWQWILSIPRDINPGFGHDPSIFQDNDKVYFLAGTFGGSAKRSVSIPSERAILFPIINFTTSYAEDSDIRDDQHMLAEAKKDIDDIVEKRLVINGVSLENIDEFRIRSQPFAIHFPENNVFGAKPGITRGVSDGYWIFLTPLPLGKHHIKTWGSCSSGRTRVDVTYDLHVR